MSAISAMTPGISTACMYPLHTEDALLEIVRMGVRSVEVFLNCMEEASPQFIKKLKSIADSEGVKILSVHPCTSGVEPLLFFSDYDRRFAEGLEIYKKFYEAANLLGAEMVVFHGAYHGYSRGLDEYIERFAVLTEAAENNGMALCHENVSRCISRYPAFFEALHKAIPAAGFVLDVKQARRAGIDAACFIRAMGEGLRHVHISDHNDVNPCMTPGRGSFDLGGFLGLLGRMGFGGGVIIELYNENFKDIAELCEGYTHITKLLP